MYISYKHAFACRFDNVCRLSRGHTWRLRATKKARALSDIPTMSAMFELSRHRPIQSKNEYFKMATDDEFNNSMENLANAIILCALTQQDIDKVLEAILNKQEELPMSGIIEKYVFILLSLY